MNSAAAAEFDAFYAARAATLVRTIYLRTGDLTRAQDCVQEAFTRAWLQWSALQAGPDPVQWVRTVAWNLAVSDWRTRMRARAREEKWRLASTAHAAPVAEVVAVREALQHLPSHQQTALILHYFEDLSIAEISAMTGKPAGTIKSNLHRARLALRTQLGDPDTAPDTTTKAGTP